MARAHGPWPRANLGLGIVMVWAFAWRASIGSAAARADYALGAVPAVITGRGALPPALDLVPAPLTLVSALFIHASPLPLVLALLCLWAFGAAVERASTALRFSLLFLGCGAFGLLAQTAMMPAVTQPLTGADGAVCAVIGAYLRLEPRAAAPLPPPVGGSAAMRRVLLLAWLLVVAL
ncbi:MAG: rhomboid family intramembrane serine protease, partial [Gammaproteobacteria bacterium]